MLTTSDCALLAAGAACATAMLTLLTCWTAGMLDCKVYGAAKEPEHASIPYEWWSEVNCCGGTICGVHVVGSTGVSSVS
jgi:hypothetical protein